MSIAESSDLVLYPSLDITFVAIESLEHAENFLGNNDKSKMVFCVQENINFKQEVLERYWKVKWIFHENAIASFDITTLRLDSEVILVNSGNFTDANSVILKEMYKVNKDNLIETLGYFNIYDGKVVLYSAIKLNQNLKVMATLFFDLSMVLITMLMK